MTDEYVILKIIARGLLDIRIASLAENSKASFAISDFIHNIPYQLNSALQGDRNFQLVLLNIKQYAEIKGMSCWLNNVLEDISIEAVN